MESCYGNDMSVNIQHTDPKAADLPHACKAELYQQVSTSHPAVLLMQVDSHADAGAGDAVLTDGVPPLPGDPASAAAGAVRGGGGAAAAAAAGAAPAGPQQYQVLAV